MQELSPPLSADHSNPQSSPENLKNPRCSFIERLMADARANRTNAGLNLQPIKPTRTSNPDSEQLTAKGILKKTIVSEVNPKFVQKPRDNFLMKGKMLSATKKPIECQMASFLLGINERIARQMQQAEKHVELPVLSGGQKETIGSSNTKFECSEIFKNLKEMRQRRSQDNAESRVMKRLAQRRDSVPKQAYTIPQQIPLLVRQTSTKKQHAITTTTMSTVTQSNHTTCPPVNRNYIQITFKKGYLAYDLEAKRFHDSYRDNLAKQFQKIDERSKEISAKAFMVVDCNTLTPISGRKTSQQIQIASITKIMTCYLCLMVCRKYNIDQRSYQVRVSEKAAQTPGTTAELQSGDILTVYQLLIGMMLPSGNDASVAIAEAMGKVIQRNKKKQTKKTYFQTFIAHMNLLSKELNLDQTWNNSSGLSINPNFSTPEAIVVLTSIAIRDPLFHEVVNTKFFELQIKNDRYGLSRKVVWRNTNKLLDNGWEGVKTGTTQNAGHCLMARKKNLLVCVFNCDTLARRFSQCVTLYERFKTFSNQ